MKRYIALRNYTEIPLLNVDKGNSLGDSKYDWYVELDDPFYLYPYLYIDLSDDHHPSTMAILTNFNVVNENLLHMKVGVIENDTWFLL